MPTYYAQTRFMKKRDEWGQVREWIEPGDEITAKDLGETEDQFRQHILSGAVMTSPPVEARLVTAPTPGTVDLQPPTQDESRDLSDNERAAGVTPNTSDGVVDLEGLAPHEAAAAQTEVPTGHNYETMDAPALKQLATERGFEKVDEMNMAELITAHREFDRDNQSSPSGDSE